MYKVGVIGNGFVGEAISFAFSPTTDLRVYDIDPLRSTHTKEEDYVFACIGGRKPLPRQKWYQHWKSLMNGIGISDYQERKLTYYSLRHYGITSRIRAGNTYSEIAEMAGTSAAYIESHYKHYDDEMLKSAAIKSA